MTRAVIGVRRPGTSLVEVLLASAILGASLLVAYGLVQHFFAGARRLDRRQLAEAISLSIQDRYHQSPPAEVLSHFESPSGGQRFLRDDSILAQALPDSWRQIDSRGFDVKVFASRVGDKAGQPGLYFTTQVSWAEGRSRRVVSHSRVFGSGMNMGSSPAPDADISGRPVSSSGAATVLPVNTPMTGLSLRGRGAAVARALAGEGPRASVVFTGDTAVLNQIRAEGQGHGSPVAVAGAAGHDVNGSADSGAPSGARGSARAVASNQPAAADSPSFDTAAAGGPASLATDPGSGRVLSGAVQDGGHQRPGSVAGAAGARSGAGDARAMLAYVQGRSHRRLSLGATSSTSAVADVSPADRDATDEAAWNASSAPVDGGPGTSKVPPSSEIQQLVDGERGAGARVMPGTAGVMGAAAVEAQWKALEGRRVAPGFYRYTAQEFVQPVDTRRIHFEVLELAPLEAGPTVGELTLVARQTFEGNSMVEARLEGAEVLERTLWSVKSAGPGKPSLPEGTVAIVERCAQRLYATRPAFHPDGTPAPFGREIAVVGWSDVEEGTSPGPSGLLALDQLKSTWGLGALAPAIAGGGRATGSVAGTSDGVASRPGQGMHREYIAAALMVPSRSYSRPVEIVSRSSGRPGNVDQGSHALAAEVGKALDLLERGHADASLELIDRALLAHPGNLDLLRTKATALMLVRRLDEAVGAFQQVIAGGGASAATYTNLAAVLIEAGHPGKAADSAREALRLSPSHLTAWTNLGVALELSGKKEEAIDAYREGLTHHPGSTPMQEGLRRVGG